MKTEEILTARGSNALRLLWVSTQRTVLENKIKVVVDSMLGKHILHTVFYMMTDSDWRR
jgi:hypothetical protein